MSSAFLVIGPGGEIAWFIYFPIYIHSSSVLKKKMLELMTDVKTFS